MNKYFHFSLDHVREIISAVKTNGDVLRRAIQFEMNSNVACYVGTTHEVTDQKIFEEANHLMPHIDCQTNYQQDHPSQSARDAAGQVSCLYPEDNTRKSEIDLSGESSYKERGLWKSYHCTGHALFSCFGQTVDQDVFDPALAGLLG